MGTKGNDAIISLSLPLSRILARVADFVRVTLESGPVFEIRIQEEEEEGSRTLFYQRCR